MELRLPPRYPIRIDRLDFWRTVERGVAEKPVTTPVALPPPEIDPAYRPGVRGARPPGGPRETRVDVDTQGLPLTRISLRTTNQTFHRPVRVLADVDGSWAEVARETIYRHEMGEFHRESLGVPLPGRRFGRLRIIVDDGDYPQLEITEVEGEHAEHRIVFPAEPGRRYHLAYGSNDMKAPRYDLAATLAAPGRPREEVSLDEPGGIPDPRHAEPSPVPFASAAWVQSALALTTAALLGGLIRAHRRAAGARTGGFDRRRARG